MELIDPDYKKGMCTMTKETKGVMKNLSNYLSKKIFFYKKKKRRTLGNEKIETLNFIYF